MPSCAAYAGVFTTPLPWREPSGPVPWSPQPRGGEHEGSHGILVSHTKNTRGRAMRNLRMGTRIRVSICVIIPALGLWVSALGPAHAEPSAECRDLAARFANAAAALDLPSLAGLMTCVSTEIQDRAGGTGPAPPPRSSEDAPPPLPTRERDQWPPPAPWGGAWPPAAPWDR